MPIFVKPLPYVTAHCYFIILDMFYCDNLVELFYNENDQEMSLSQTVDQTKVPWGRNTEHFMSWLHFVII